MQPRIQYTRTSDGVSIAYSVMGSGSPLVRTGGFWTSHLSQEWEMFPLWRDFYLALAERMTVIRYDPRGCGMSDRHDLDFSLEARLTDIDAVVEAGTSGQSAFLGIGAGCLATVAYAVEHSERVSKLILIDPYSSGTRWDRDNQITRFMTALESVSADQWDAVTEALAGRVTAGRVAVEGDARTRIAALARASMSPEAFVAYRKAAREIDVTPLLSRITSPTLVIQHEGGVAPDRSREVASLISGCQLVGLPGERRQTIGPQEAAATLDFVGAAAQAIAGAAVHAPEVITVLWTDIVGHTEMMRRLGDDKGREVLREHERITREVLKAHGGTEVKTMGDGFMASFGSVTRAVECAVALQRAFEERNLALPAHPEALEGRAARPSSAHGSRTSPRAGRGSRASSAEPLHVRVGLNAGEPIKEEGDLFGSTVILASRIATKAAGGEILASDVVRGLCSGKGLLFADRGEFVAKGFEEPVRVFEVRWRDS